MIKGRRKQADNVRMSLQFRTSVTRSRFQLNIDEFSSVRLVQLISVASLIYPIYIPQHASC